MGKHHLTTSHLWLRTLGVSVVLIGFGLVVGLGGIEVVLRAAGMGSDQLLQQDATLGVRYIPGKRGLTQGACFSATATINSHGWRSRETSWEKPDDVYRIVVLGDSFMGALQVEDDETFAAVLEDALNTAGLPKRIEVINLGVPSFGNDQAYLALRHFGRKYRPDFVLLAFYAQNDVKNNSMVLERRNSVYPKPFLALEEGEVVEMPFEDATPASIRIVRQLVQPLRLYPWLRGKLMQLPLVHRVLYQLGIIGVVPRENRTQKLSGRYPSRWIPQSEVFKRENSPEWEHAWALTEAILRRIRGDARQIGAGFLLVRVAEPLAVLPKSVLDRALPASIGAALDIDKPARRLQAFVAEAEIDFLSLIPTFHAQIGERETTFAKFYLTCDGHWTVAGHQLAAETVAAYLKPILQREP